MSGTIPVPRVDVVMPVFNGGCCLAAAVESIDEEETRSACGFGSPWCGHPDVDLKAIRELCRVPAPGGNLMVAVPVGRVRIQYNAHRIYDGAKFRDYFAGLEPMEFMLIPDGEVPIGLIYDASRDLVNAQEYGRGCYWFRKPSAGSV
jgi:hypothetical protein